MTTTAASVPPATDADRALDIEAIYTNSEPFREDYHGIRVGTARTIIRLLHESRQRVAECAQIAYTHADELRAKGWVNEADACCGVGNAILDAIRNRPTGPAASGG